MDAILKKILISPVKRDKNNEITGPSTALITIEVPLDGVKQQQAIFEVMNILNNDWVKVSISTTGALLHPQISFPELMPDDERSTGAADACANFSLITSF